MRTAEERRRAMLWGAAAALTAATFSPAVLPMDRVEPTLAGMPYTLWAGVVVALLFVGLTAAATRLYHDDDAPTPGDRP